MKLFVLLACFLLSGVVISEAKKRLHHYEYQDEVPFEVNKIGPYANPSETYEYYSLPFCQPEKLQHKHSSLGEDLSGDHKFNALYDVRFRGNFMKIFLSRLVPILFLALCKTHLKPEEVEEFKYAIEHLYYFEMLYGLRILTSCFNFL